MNVSGKFDVGVTPLEPSFEGQNGVRIGRRAIQKRFHGDLEGTSRGEMLSAMTVVDGSAGYVAIEQVQGSLGGKTGSFVLQHYGVMDKGRDRLVLEVIPDSGTGELRGLSGTMSINIEDGKHYYDFEYEGV